MFATQTGLSLSDIALLHSQLLDQGVLAAVSNDPLLRVYAHCSKQTGGEVALAVLNLAKGNATLDLPPSTESWTAWILTAGERIEGAPNPLQSRHAQLNGVQLELGEDGDVPPVLAAGVHGSAGSDELQFPPTSYGFITLHGVRAAACV